MRPYKSAESILDLIGKKSIVYAGDSSSFDNYKQEHLWTAYFSGDLDKYFPEYEITFTEVVESDEGEEHSSNAQQLSFVTYDGKMSGNTFTASWTIRDESDTYDAPMNFLRLPVAYR